jgi:hypothetical protein
MLSIYVAGLKCWQGLFVLFVKRLFEKNQNALSELVSHGRWKIAEFGEAVWSAFGTISLDGLTNFDNFIILQVVCKNLTAVDYHIESSIVAHQHLC